MKLTALKNMSFDALVALRDAADKLVVQRTAAERKSLEQRLSNLSRFFGGGTSKRQTRKGRKAAPKYRNPADRSQTWAGRGLRPRWLQEQLKQGRKIEEFAIAKTAPARAKRSPSRKKAGKKT